MRRLKSCHCYVSGLGKIECHTSREAGDPCPKKHNRYIFGVGCYGYKQTR